MSTTLIDMLDAPTEAFIQEVTAKASYYVANHIREMLFLDNERYGKDINGHRVKIFLKDSQLINKAFELATGVNIDEYVQNLHFGVKHLAKIIKSHLQKMVATQLSNKLAELSVGRMVERVLLQGYGLGKEVLANRVEARFKDKTDKTEQDQHLAAILNEANLKTFVDTDVTTKTLQNSDFDQEEHISLQKILACCEYQFKSYLNGLIQQVTAHAIAKAARKVSEASAEKFVDVHRMKSLHSLQAFSV